jgi:hypothetical protein
VQVEEDILKLDIAMGYALCMKVLNRLQHLKDDFPRLWLEELLLSLLV